MLQDASQTMYSAYKDYIKVWRKKNPSKATQWISTQHKTFNANIRDIVRNIKADNDASANLIK